MAHTIVNALAVVSGMVCDGAKPSCAAKIAAAIDAGILGYELYCRGQEFLDGDGIVRKGVDNTIGNVGRMARSGMRETDRVILDPLLSPIPSVKKTAHSTKCSIPVFGPSTKFP
ncbi:MAG: hypothetical protein BHW33_06570 [Firmicutes bacterium CAG:137_57_8]|nr:MAG: hypothetical protein BHW33_06570 [Firmicutes bacterium CAG:137_57_8]